MNPLGTVGRDDVARLGRCAADRVVRCRAQCDPIAIVSCGLRSRAVSPDKVALDRVVVPLIDLDAVAVPLIDDQPFDRDAADLELEPVAAAGLISIQLDDRLPRIAWLARPVDDDRVGDLR